MQFFWTFLTFLSTHRVHINDPNKEYLHYCNVQIKKYIENNNYVIILKITLYNLFKKNIYCLLFNSLMQRVSTKKNVYTTKRRIVQGKRNLLEWGFQLLSYEKQI